MMLRTIIYKEIAEVIRSFRFHVLIIISLVLFFFAGLLQINCYNTRIEDYNIYKNKQLLLLKQQSKSLCVLATVQQYMIRKPKAGDIISLDGEKNLPDLIYFKAFGPGGSDPRFTGRSQLIANTDHSNYKLNGFALFDWSFLAGVILSFFILVLTHDVFSGEKQAGTLKLRCAFPVSRMSIFVGKYLAYLLIITLLFILGITLNLITVKLASGSQIEIPSLLQTGGIVFSYMIYFSLFILMGMWFSSKARQPATSLVYSLFTWLMMVFFIPSSMAMLGEKIHPIPTAFELNEQKSAAINQIWENAPPKAQSYGPPSAYGGKVYPHMALRKKAIDEIMTEINKYTIRGFNDMYRQAKLGYNLGKISPFVIMRNISERIAGNGLEDLYKDFNRMVVHQKMLLNFIEEKDREDPESFHFVNAAHPETYSSAPVGYDEIPVIEDNDPELIPALKDSVTDIGVLVFFNLVVLVVAWSGFLRYDVR